MLTLLVPLFTRAQNCTTIINYETGKLNKTGVVFFSYDHSPEYPVLTILKQGDDFKIGFAISLSKITKEFSPENICIFATFANGERKKIPASAFSNSSSSKSGMFITFLSSPVNADILYFKQNLIKTLSISLTGTDISDRDTKISNSIAKDILKTFACVTE